MEINDQDAYVAAYEELEEMDVPSQDDEQAYAAWVKRSDELEEAISDWEQFGGPADRDSAMSERV